jgi:hypothetical protein
MGITVKFLSFRHLTFQEWRWLLEGWIYLYTSRINWQREKSSPTEASGEGLYPFLCKAGCD